MSSCQEWADARWSNNSSNHVAERKCSIFPDIPKMRLSATARLKRELPSCKSPSLYRVFPEKSEKYSVSRRFFTTEARTHGKSNNKAQKKSSDSPGPNLFVSYPGLTSSRTPYSQHSSAPRWLKTIALQLFPAIQVVFDEQLHSSFRSWRMSLFGVGFYVD